MATKTNSRRNATQTATTDMATLEKNAVTALRQFGVGKDNIASQLGISRTRTRRIVDEVENQSHRVAKR